MIWKRDKNFALVDIRPTAKINISLPMGDVICSDCYGFIRRSVRRASPDGECYYYWTACCIGRRTIFSSPFEYPAAAKATDISVYAPEGSRVAKDDSLVAGSGLLTPDMLWSDTITKHKSLTSAVRVQTKK